MAESNTLEQIQHHVSTLLKFDVSLTPIETGHSQACFLAKAYKKNFVVKCFNDTQLLNIEAQALKFGATKQLTPQVIAKSDTVLVIDFISDATIRDGYTNPKDKLLCLTSALAEFHQVFNNDAAVFPVTQLQFLPVISEIAKNCTLSKTDKETLHVVEQIAAQVDGLGLDNCICHGDFNQDNVFCGDTGFTIIDFEAMSIAPPAYDLMMMLSINEFDQAQINEAVGHYNLSNPTNPITLSNQTLQRLFMLSNAINGFWYLSKSQSGREENALFQELASRFLSNVNA